MPKTRILFLCKIKIAQVKIKNGLNQIKTIYETKNSVK